MIGSRGISILATAACILALTTPSSVEAAQKYGDDVYAIDDDAKYNNNKNYNKYGYNYKYNGYNNGYYNNKYGNNNYNNNNNGNNQNNNMQ